MRVSESWSVKRMPGPSGSGARAERDAAQGDPRRVPGRLGPGREAKPKDRGREKGGDLGADVVFMGGERANEWSGCGVEI